MSERFSDEILMAYADGELEASARDEVAEALARDAGLRKRLRIFERTGTVIGEAFDIVLSTERAVTEPPVRRDAPAHWRAKLRQALAPAYAYRLAAAAAVLVIAGSAIVLRPFVFAPHEPLVIASEDGRLQAAGPLRVALETQPSKGFRTAPVDSSAITQTFRDQQGRFCREYIAMSGSSRGIACRATDGNWLIALHFSGAATNDAATTAPAGSGQDQLIDGYVHQIMTGNPLTLAGERLAIKRHWDRE